MTRVAEHAHGKYLGCEMRITERCVTVFAPASGRVIGTAYSISGARRIAKGYRGGKQ